MKTLQISLLVFLVTSLQLIQAARLARNCNSKWQKSQRCNKDGVSKGGQTDSSFPVPNDGERKRLDGAVNNCFINELRCTGSPIPTSQQAKDRADCFNQVKKKLQGQLQTCVKRSIDDFTMPDDVYDPNNDWGFRVKTVKDAINNPKPLCGNANKQALQSCVNNLGYNWNKRPPNKAPPYVCQVDADCWYNWGSDCQGTWEYQVTPQLCQCSQDMQKQKAVKNAQDQYKTCLTGKGQTPPKDDPILKWIDTYLRSMCNNAQNNPCKREREAASKRLTSQKSG